MIFRQLYDLTSSTFTYLLACKRTGEAVLIDPVYELAQRDLALIYELGLTLTHVLDTHCHADHVTASWELKRHTACKNGSAKTIGASNVDLALSDGDVIHFGDEHLEVLATPGHTDGCLSFVMADQNRVFTGDALLIRGCGRCDFQQGDARRLYQSVTKRIFSLPENYAVYPGHDYSGRLQSSVAEEIQFNTRLGGQASEQDFVGYMNAMQLPHPKLIDHAVPANLKSGRPDEDQSTMKVNWAPVQFSYSGVPEIDVEWVINNRQRVHILDVREPSELDSRVDRLADSQVIPLAQLRGRIDEISRHKPIVCLCRSGRRSAMAVSILLNCGFENVANAAGGMLRWQEFS